MFDGKGEAPWQPDCATFAPLNVYGKSKLAGEIAVRETLENHFIVRISWAFGKTGNNFVKTMLRMGQTHDIIRVVCDQIGTPTYTEDLSRLLVDMIETDRYGTYHATNEGGYISWYDFACEIFRQAEMDCVKVLPVTTAEYGLRKAARPFNSRLDKQKLSKNGFISLPDWHDALRRYLQTAKGRSQSTTYRDAITAVCCLWHEYKRRKCRRLSTSKKYAFNFCYHARVSCGRVSGSVSTKRCGSGPQGH